MLVIKWKCYDYDKIFLIFYVKDIYFVLVSLIERNDIYSYSDLGIWYKFCDFCFNIKIKI